MNIDKYFPRIVTVLLVMIIALSISIARGQDEIEKMVYRMSGGGSIPAEIFVAMAKVESSFNDSAMGDGGRAYGLFQIHEPAAIDSGVDYCGDMMNLYYHPVLNTEVAIFYLYKIYNRLDGNLWCAVSAFNKGSSRISSYDLSVDCQHHRYVKKVKKALGG